MTPHEKRVSIFETKEQYLQMKESWAKTENHTNVQHMMYNILRGYELNRGFTPLINQKKIDNGGQWNTGEYHAQRAIKYHHQYNWERFHPDWVDGINEILMEKAYELAFLEASND